MIDIETSPNLGWTWGKWETDILRYKREWELLSFAYKVLGKPVTHCISRPQFKDKTDRSIVKAVWKILDGADVLIGHNIDEFDNKKLKAKFIEHSLPPPRPYKTIDTRKIAKSQFAFMSNSLNDLAFTLKLGRKVSAGGIDLWFECMDGKRSAWRKMVKYNRYDVILLEKVYERLKSWYPSHPNLALYAEAPGCPVCKSMRVQRRGWMYMRVAKRPRLQCRECNHWFSGAVRGMS